ncbi:MAG: BatD family protein [Bacteroidetes bacterium]|nr:BatD family protein [Bacteroidota bacterium]
MKVSNNYRLIGTFRNVLVLLILSVSAVAQTFTGSVNRSQVGLNEQIQLTYTINANGTSFKTPSLTEFSVLSGPNQSTSMQFVNGSMSQSISFSFILQPKKEGTFKIEPATIESGGKIILSNMVSVTVVKGSGQNAQGGGQNQDDKTNISTKNIFIRVSVDKNSVYQGRSNCSYLQTVYKCSSS